MEAQELKLKQACAVLQMPSKELQNLVQFGVVHPRRREGTYLFDTNALLTAKVAFCLKEYLGTQTKVLSRLMKAFVDSADKLKSENPQYVVFIVQTSTQEDPLKLEVPFRTLEEELQMRLARVDLYKDLPRGRKRRGWKKDFLSALTEAAKDIGEISEDEILQTIGEYRRQKRVPEISVTAQG
jgi:hypothetical protein